MKAFLSIQHYQEWWEISGEIVIAFNGGLTVKYLSILSS